MMDGRRYGRTGVLLALLFALLILAVAGVHVSHHSSTPAAPALRLERTIPLEDVQGRLDHMAVDVRSGRLFLAALGNDTLEVVDLRGARRIQSVRGFHEPQGVAYIPEQDRVVVTNGHGGTCDVLDGRTLRTLRSTALGDDADNIRYDHTRGQVVVGHGHGGLTALDASTGAALGTARLPAHPEAFELDPSGARAFVNLPGADCIAVVDRHTWKITATWPLTGARSNFPMALDAVRHRLFVGCRRPARLLVYDTQSGRRTASLPIDGDADDVFYDPTGTRLFVSCGAGAVNVFRQDAADRYTSLGEVPTAPGARTSLFVPRQNRLYVAAPRGAKRPAEIRVYDTAASAGHPTKE
jgi:DNA-binding beta-propeller fold protein YncE